MDRFRVIRHMKNEKPIQHRKADIGVFHRHQPRLQDLQFLPLGGFIRFPVQRIQKIQLFIIRPREKNIMPRIGERAPPPCSRNDRVMVPDGGQGFFKIIGHRHLQAIYLGNGIQKAGIGADGIPAAQIPEGIVAGGKIPEHQGQETGKIPC